MASDKCRHCGNQNEYWEHFKTAQKSGGHEFEPTEPSPTKPEPSQVGPDRWKDLTQEEKMVLEAYARGDYFISQNGDESDFGKTLASLVSERDKLRLQIEDMKKECENCPDVAEAKAERDALLDALKEIAKGEGAYDHDQLKHAGNTIRNMKELATDAIGKAIKG